MPVEIYFMTNLHENMGPGRDRILNPWICSQTPGSAVRQVSLLTGYAAQCSKWVEFK